MLPNNCCHIFIIFITRSVFFCYSLLYGLAHTRYKWREWGWHGAVSPILYWTLGCNWWWALVFAICSQFGVINFYYILQPFFAFLNEEKFSENGWMVYNPMSEYRRQVSYYSCHCLVLSHLPTCVEDLLFVHFSCQLLGEDGIATWRKVKKINKMLEPLRKSRMSQEGNLWSLKEVIDASYNVPLLSEHRVGQMCQMCNYNVLNVDWIFLLAKMKWGKKKQLVVETALLYRNYRCLLVFLFALHVILEKCQWKRMIFHFKMSVR